MMPAFFLSFFFALTRRQAGLEVCFHFYLYYIGDLLVKILLRALSVFFGGAGNNFG